MLKMVVAGLIGGYLFRYLHGDWTLGLLLAGIGCELGHMFPVFFGFKGGKGILSGGTLVIMLDWRVALIAWALFMLLWLVTKYVSLGSVCGTATVPVTTFLFLGHNWLYFALSLVVVGLIIYCHRENIVRLVKRQENKFSWHIGPPEQQ